MGHNRTLTQGQKEFISNNHKTMSDKKISKILKISKAKVKAYKEHMISGTSIETPANDTDRPILNTNRFFAKIIPAILFIAILLFAFNLRKSTFNLPHHRGDQHHYIGLAMKLDKQGMNGYNLRNIDMYGSRQYPNLVTFAIAKDKGHVLKSLAQANINYYDEPLHHMPFGFPAALMISHKLFASSEPYHTLAIPNDTKVIQEAGPGVGLRKYRFDPAVSGKQFYAVIIPLFFSLFTIVCIYFLSKKLFNDEFIALTAMFLMAISPIALLTSQKIWAEDMTLAFLTLSALLYLSGTQNKKPVLAFAAGIACGISVITKQNGALIGFTVIGWHFLSNLDRLFKKDTFLKVIFDKNFILFGAGCIISSGYWFYKITAQYGNPLYKPHQENLVEMSKTAWFQMVHSRPKHLYLLGIPYQNPVFSLAYLSPLWLFIDKMKKKDILFPVIWLIVSFIAAYKLFGGEHRYMLPSYPAFAILAAFVANELRKIINNLLGFHTGTALLIIALIISAYWSIPMAQQVIFTNGALIMKPF